MLEKKYQEQSCYTLIKTKYFSWKFLDLSKIYVRKIDRYFPFRSQWNGNSKTVRVTNLYSYL